MTDHWAQVRALEARRRGLEAEVEAASRALSLAREEASAATNENLNKRLTAAALSMGYSPRAYQLQPAAAAAEGRNTFCIHAAGAGKSLIGYLAASA
jgi:hypothetical protein